MFETRKELFYKIEAQAAEIVRLESELLASEAKITAAANTDESVAALTEDLEAAKTALAEQEAKANQEVEAIKQSLAAAEAKASPEAIQALVTAQIAGSGHPPLNVDDGSVNEKAENTLTISAFNNLTPKARMAFIKANGKLID